MQNRLANPRRRSRDLKSPLLPPSGVSVLTLVIMGLIVLLAVGPQSALGRIIITAGYNCTIRDSDDALLYCAGSGELL